ncbi:MAG: hypothetical protein JNL01_14250 [Bdellovibrionales bacterium]|nr:hypothetical protein [Bdellovibrionales bacterium]
MMKKQMIFLAVFLADTTALGATTRTTFDKEKLGSVPKGWTTGNTGKGEFKWTIEKDESAPSKAQVLKQSATGDYPWAVKEGTSLKDGFVEVTFKPISGEEDQAGGLVWRFKDGHNYYVARANALENNVSIYYTEDGKRKTIKYVNADDFGGNVKVGTWHALRVEFQGQKTVVLLDGKKAIEIEDDHISTPGRVGLWTKADSVTAFDNFSHGEIKAGVIK